MKGTLALFLVVFSAVAFPAPVSTDMYKWTDKAGVVHFSSQPGDPAAELLKEGDLAPISETGETAPGLVPGKASFPGAITVTGGLLYDGRPLPEFTAAPAVIRLYN